ncbi:uncharacterized protein METZ01_LOCUS163646, partial [marine metagenome]
GVDRYGQQISHSEMYCYSKYLDGSPCRPRSHFGI